jgi:hypothetical protein
MKIFEEISKLDRVTLVKYCNELEILNEFACPIETQTSLIATMQSHSTSFGICVNLSLVPQCPIDHPWDARVGKH